MNPGLVVKLRPAGPWRIGPDSGARNRVDAIYHSDSLYSAVTSAMSRMGSLAAWLDATARSQTPAVCFSSCFPFLDDIGFVVPPRTIWPPTSPAAMAARVRWKSARFIPLSVVESILAGKRLNENQWSVDGPSACLVPAGKPGPFRTSVRWNAAVDRLSGASDRHATACIEFREGCGLWTVAGFRDAATRDQWQEPVKAAFRWLADSGFGGERSRGWGRSETPEFVEGTLPGLIIEYRRKEPPAVEAEPAAEAAPAVETAPPESEPLAEAEAAGPLVGQALSPANAHAEPAAEIAPDDAAEPVGAATGVPRWGRERFTEQVAVPEPEAEAAPPDAEPAARPAPEAEVAAEPLPTPAGYPSRGSDGHSPETASAAVAAPEATVPDAVPAAVVAPEGTLPEPRPETQVGEAVPAPPIGEPPIEEPPITEPPPAEEPGPVPVPLVEGETTVPDPASEAQDTLEPLPTPAGYPGCGSDGSASEAAPETEPAAPQPEAAPIAAAVRAPDRTEPMRVATEREPAAPIPAPAVHLQAHWLLSLFTPAASDTVDWGRGSYTVLARGGRIDSPSGSGELKKQIQMVAEGSVLYADGVPLGAAPDVAPDGFAHPVFRAGFALAIPLPEVH